MSAILASAMLLQCFFNHPADGSVASGDIPVIKVSVPDEMAESLSGKQPPVNRYRFTGEEGGIREWVFGNPNDAAAASVKLLRIALSDGPLSPSPYSARFGTAVRNDDGSYRFENKMTGYCKLLPTNSTQ